MSGIAEQIKYMTDKEKVYVLVLNYLRTNDDLEEIEGLLAELATKK